MKLRALPAMFSMIPATLQGVRPQDIDQIKKITRLSFPRVQQTSTETLARWMAEGDSLLLIDVRAAKEFQVSHLYGALNFQSATRIWKIIQERGPSRTVLYCSVGFRSSRIAEVLLQREVSNVSNLEGSIFAWANEDRPVYQGETAVPKVHPYGRRWAGLLRNGLAAFQ